MKKQKPIYYLLIKPDADPALLHERKESLCRQGYLVITVREGRQDMKDGLREVIRNHVS